jgi:glycosyltransferase involved in cell wall biosynthesis
LQKNQTTLIRAFAQLIKKHPNLQLTILGDGEDRSILEQLIQTLGVSQNVFLSGAVKNVAQELLKADVFVFPSLYEGFPNALCEAMSVGLPVIASNVTGNRDLVVHHENGLLFEAQNVDDLFNQMTQIMDINLRRKLTKKSINVTVDYSADKIYARWITMIEDVCAA